MGVKPQVLVELQEDKTYYADDIIPITISLRLEREWKNPYLTLSFKGYASSYKNSIRQHNESIFGYDEDIPIEDYNKQPYNTTHEIRTVVSVPRDTTIPCSKKVCLMQKEKENKKTYNPISLKVLMVVKLNT